MLNVHDTSTRREETERERDLQGKHYFDLTCSAFYSKVSSLELHRRRLNRLRLRGSVTGARTTPAACAQTAFTGVWPLGRGSPEEADSLDGELFGNGGGGGGRAAGVVAAVHGLSTIGVRSR